MSRESAQGFVSPFAPEIGMAIKADIPDTLRIGDKPVEEVKFSVALVRQLRNKPQRPEYRGESFVSADVPLRTRSEFNHVHRFASVQFHEEAHAVRHRDGIRCNRSELFVDQFIV